MTHSVLHRGFLSAILLIAGIGSFHPLSVLALDAAKPISEFIHETWSVDDGLPQSTVRAIVQTRDGYLWLATHEGVARFDGRRFTVFNEANTPVMRGSGVAAMREMSDGSLWLGLRDGGVIRAQHDRFVAVAPVGGIPRSSVSAILGDPSGAVWIGTSGGGLARISGGKSRVFTTADGLPSNTVTALALLQTGELMVGTFAGVVSLRDDTVTRNPTGHRPDRAAIEFMVEDRQKRLWIATNGDGLFFRDGNKWNQLDRKNGLLSDTLTHVYQDRAGSVWIGSIEGLHRWQDGRLERFAAAEGLSNNYVRIILEDAEGGMWVGTNGGLDRIRDGFITTWGARRGITEEFVRAAIEDRKGNIWVGTADGLFRVSSSGVRRFGKEEGLLNSSVLSLTEGRDGTIWIGTPGGGLHRTSGERIENVSARYGLSSASVRAIVDARDGNLWVGTNAGLFRIRANGEVRKISTTDGLPSDQVLSLHEDKTGQLWVGTREGAARIDGRNVTSLGTENGLGGFVLAIAEDSEGHLMFTTGGGLVIMNQGKPRRFSVEEGLPARAYFNAVDDKRGFIWLCSNQGIVRIYKKEVNDVLVGAAKQVQPRLLGRADGMTTAQCNGGSQPAGWLLRDGRLLFATAKGLALVDPGRQVLRNTLPPPVHIIDVSIDAEAVPVTDHLEVPAGRHRLEITYVGLSLVDPDRMRFRYRLEGFDRDWVDAGNERKAVYTNVTPGSYRFRVIAANNDGVWNESGATLTIEQNTPFFQTSWFRMLFGLGVIVMIIVAYRARVAQLNAQAQTLKKLIDERTHDLAREKEKLELANEEKAQLLTQVKVQSEAFEKMSKEDALTGLWNRRELDRFLSLEFERARRSQRPLAVVMADIDHFKQVNDRFSHAVGDEVLRTIAEILQAECRSIDMIARYGGEEFALVLPETSIEEGVQLCDRLRVIIETRDWTSIKPGLHITMSFGVAEAAGQANHEKCLNMADAKLYEAKAAGRNRVCS
jgi:diguanylate cyclase (GGDEF)-like protein